MNSEKANIRTITSLQNDKGNDRSCCWRDLGPQEIPVGGTAAGGRGNCTLYVRDRRVPSLELELIIQGLSCVTVAA